MTFIARSKEKPDSGEPHHKVQVTIPGLEFVQRWAMHILPKYFFKVRHYDSSVIRIALSIWQRSACRDQAGGVRGDRVFNSVVIDKVARLYES